MDNSNTIEEKFNQLPKRTYVAEEWRNETGGYSLITQKYNHPLYKQIIDMGDSILPFLLKEYHNTHKYWRIAITEIKSKQFPSTYLK